MVFAAFFCMWHSIKALLYSNLLEIQVNDHRKCVSMISMHQMILHKWNQPWLSFLCGIPLYAEFFFPVRILRNDKSSLYPKKRYYQVKTLISALMRMVLCIKIMFKRVKLQFIWQIKIVCGFCGNKNHNHGINLIPDGPLGGSSLYITISIVPDVKVNDKAH